MKLSSSNSKTKNKSTSSLTSPSSSIINTQPSVSTQQPSSNYHILEEMSSTNNNNNNNNSMIPNPLGTGEDPMLMMQMLQQYMQMNNNGSNNNQGSSTTTNQNNGAPPVDPMMMMKMLQMFSGGMQQPHVSNMLLTPPPPSSSNNSHQTSSSIATAAANTSNRSSNRSSSPTRSPSPPPRPSSPTVIQQEDDMSNVPSDILAQKYNLVEKKKRKMRCGKKRGPQEEFIFHLKLEQDKKKKRRSAQAAQAATANASAMTTSSTVAASSSTQQVTTNSIPASSSSSSIIATGNSNNANNTTTTKDVKQTNSSSASSIPNSSSKTSTATPPTSYPPPPPSSLQKKTSSSNSIGGTELKTKQRKTTKKLQEAASGRSSKASSSEDISEPASTNNINTSKENHPILPPTTQPSSLPLPMSTSNPSLSSIPIPMSTNFINNIPTDITSLLMPKLTPSADNFLGTDEMETWQDIPQFTNTIQHSEFSTPYPLPTLQQKPKGCYYGDKSKGKKVQKVPISQSSSRLQIINNRKKTSIIGSIIDILSDDTSITNHTIPSMVTLLDGFVVKVNEAMKDMLGFDSVNDIEFRSNLQNYLHPQDIIKHDILLLQMLSTNSDSCKHSIKFVNRNGKCAPLSTEFCCIRNEMGLPQWIVIRLSNPNMKSTNIEENHTDIVLPSQLNHTVSDYDMGHISRESLINDSPQTFQDMFLKILERLFGSKQPTCFYDKQGYILWNNERFDALFNNHRKNFFGRRVYDIPEMKGTIMEILSNSVLMDFPDKLEAQMSPDEHSMNSSQIYDSRLKMNCYGQKVTENNGTVFGYVWMFSVIREESTEISQTPIDNNYNVNQEDMFEDNGDFFQ